MSIARSPDIHWSYAIYAVQFLQFLIRRDVLTSPSQVEYLLEKLSDSNETIVSAAQDYYFYRGL